MCVCLCVRVCVAPLLLHIYDFCGNNPTPLPVLYSRKRPWTVQLTHAEFVWSFPLSKMPWHSVSSLCVNLKTGFVYGINHISKRAPVKLAFWQYSTWSRIQTFWHHKKPYLDFLSQYEIWHWCLASLTFPKFMVQMQPFWLELVLESADAHMYSKVMLFSPWHCDVAKGPGPPLPVLECVRSSLLPTSMVMCQRTFAFKGLTEVFTTLRLSLEC